MVVPPVSGFLITAFSQLLSHQTKPQPPLMIGAGTEWHMLFSWIKQKSNFLKIMLKSSIYFYLKMNSWLEKAFRKRGDNTFPFGAG